MTGQTAGVSGPPATLNQAQSSNLGASQPPTPRAQRSQRSPREFVIGQEDAAEVQRQIQEADRQAEAEILAKVRAQLPAEGAVSIEIAETNPPIETVVLTPRREEAQQSQSPQPLQSFSAKRDFFERISRGESAAPSSLKRVATVSTTTTGSPGPSPRALPKLPSSVRPQQEGAEIIVASPRREAKAVLPPFSPREPEKKT